ncbi:hypothetical protein, partial [Phascolarctobacterium succinatutens]|uniref:hypothetical protein n=1 Tax=Phascolarctobacterium succinatutens TaxID=626940 RepID=UPI0026F1B7F9
MKKMLAKAVVLGLVLGGIGFVANDAQAAKIGDGVKVHSGAGVDGTGLGQGHDIKTAKKLGKDAALAEQKDLEAVNDEVAQANTNIATNKDNIAANKTAIANEAKARDEADKAEAKARDDADKAEAKARDEADKAEAKARDEADKAEAKARD